MLRSMGWPSGSDGLPPVCARSSLPSLADGFSDHAADCASLPALRERPEMAGQRLSQRDPQQTYRMAPQWSLNFSDADVQFPTGSHCVQLRFTSMVL